MATDYEALAKQYGAVFTPDEVVETDKDEIDQLTSDKEVDYFALAEEYGAVFTPTPEIPQMDASGEVTLPGVDLGPKMPEDPILAKERLLGAAEVLTTLATAPTTGALGMLGGTIGGLTAAILRGEFGTPEAARLIEQAAAGGMEQLTYAPRTEAGQQYMQAIAEPLQAVPAFVPAMGAAGAIPAALTAGGASGQDCGSKGC